MCACMLYIYNNYNIHHRDLMGLGRGVGIYDLVSTRFENERIKFIYMKYNNPMIVYVRCNDSKQSTRDL